MPPPEIEGQYGRDAIVKWAVQAPRRGPTAAPARPPPRRVHAHYCEGSSHKIHSAVKIVIPAL